MFFRFRKSIGMWATAFAALSFGLTQTSCDDEVDTEYIYETVYLEKLENLISGTSDTTIINTKNFVIDSPEQVRAIEFNKRVLGATGWHVEKTLNLVVMGSLVLTADSTKEDTTQQRTKNVTLVNKGNITIYTKNIVAKYLDQIVDQTNLDDSTKYYYIRFIGMIGGENGNVINDGNITVVFDHELPKEAEKQITVYAFGMSAETGTTMVNNGTIEFKGKGSPRTRARGMASSSNNITCLNKGTMTTNIEMVEDFRFITMGGDKVNITNQGVMQGKQPGTFYGMTRLVSNNLTNTGEINMTSVDFPTDYGYTAAAKSTCGALYCMVNYEIDNPTMINKGKINITMAGKTVDNAFGMYIHLPKAAECNRKYVRLINDGEINVTYSGETAPTQLYGEAGVCTMPNMPVFPMTIDVKSWNTKLRDFSKQHLFAAQCGEFDFNGARLNFAPEKEGEYKVDEAALLCKTTETVTVKNYEKKIIAFSKDGDKCAYDAEAETCTYAK